MSKFLNKSLIVAMSSLCAFSTSMDARTFKPDKALSYQKAIKNSDRIEQTLEGIVDDQTDGEENFINRENPGSFRNYKDIAQNVIEGVAELGLGATMGGLVANSAFSDKAVPAGVALGAIAAGFLFIPAKVRAIKNILRNEELLKALYRLSSLRSYAVIAKSLETESNSRKTGTFALSSR